MSVGATLDALSHRDRPRLVARLRRWLGCHAAAEDAVQDAFLRLVGMENVAAVAEPGAYFARAARNAALDRRRGAEHRAGPPEGIPATLACPVPGPEQVALHRARVRRFDAALSALTATQRAMVVAARLEGEPYGCIAARHGVSVDAVEKTVARALRRLAAATDPDEAPRAGT